jgi:lipoprotein-anchoring transpeptidase ErfK/SrfK
MTRIPRPWVTAVALLVTGLLGVSVGGADAPRTPRLTEAAFAGTDVRPGRGTNRPAVTLDITPAANAKNLPVSTEIGTKVRHGTVSSVTLREDGGGQVAGAMRPDGTSWMPDTPLRLGRTYTAEVTATGPGGRTATRSVTFSTMKSANQRIDTSLYLRHGATYGVAMPVVIQFDEDVPESARPAVQRRLFVTSNPPQPGAWRWFSGRQVLYRPPSYWRPGTTLSVRAALDGVPMGKGRYGDEDHVATATIGRDLRMAVDNRTKSMSVFQNGKLLKTMPVSLGKASTPSSSGTMVVMERAQSTVFDTFAELGPVEGYRIPVQYAQRLTWGGEFIHSAPWSVYDQGRRNVSHGCVNISPTNARWLFQLTKIGDPVTVRGTQRRLAPGNGWTAWNMSWTEFLNGTSQ